MAKRKKSMFSPWKNFNPNKYREYALGISCYRQYKRKLSLITILWVGHIIQGNPQSCTNFGTLYERRS